MGLAGVGSQCRCWELSLWSSSLLCEGCQEVVNPDVQWKLESGLLSSMVLNTELKSMKSHHPETSL